MSRISIRAHGYPEGEQERDLAAHFELGVAHYKAGRLDEAIAEFHAALKLDPTHAPSHYNLALRLESKGRHAEAAAAFEAFLACANAEERKLEPAIRSRIAGLKGLAAEATLSLDDPQGTLTLGGASAPAPPGGAPAQPGVAWRQGDLIDELYEVREVVGEGGFGSVHRVFPRGWGMDLAGKAPRADKVAKRQALESFVQEANAWVGLGLHPNIVTCFFVRVMGVPRIFIEYMAGGSLADRLAAGRYGDTKASIDCAVQIARAMEYVHRRHRSYGKECQRQHNF